MQDATTNVKAGDELEPSEGNYYGHTTSKFWVDGGRSFSEPDCRIDPVIIFGEREYVIFGPLDYNVGFENIAVEGDKWLEFIKKRLRGETSMRPFPKPLESYLANSAAIVRFRAEWLKDKVIWSEEVLKGDMSSYAHALFISPAAFFDTAVNPNCSNYGYRRNAELFDRIYVEAWATISNAGVNDFAVMSDEAGVFVLNDEGRHSGVFEEDKVPLDHFLKLIQDRE